MKLVQKPLTRADVEGLAMLLEKPRQKSNANGSGRIGGWTAARLRKRGLAYEHNGLVYISDAGLLAIGLGLKPARTPETP